MNLRLLYRTMPRGAAHHIIALAMLLIAYTVIWMQAGWRVSVAILMIHWVITMRGRRDEKG